MGLTMARGEYQSLPGRLKDVAGGGVIVAFLDHLEDRLSLGS